MSIEKLSTNASLKQVMDKFEEISLQDFSSMDIKVLKELPSTVKEGQLIIVEEDKFSVVGINNKPISEAEINDNEIYIKCSDYSDNSAEKVVVGSSEVVITLYLSAIYKKQSGVISPCPYVYIGCDGIWKRVLEPKLVIFENGVFGSSDLTIEASNKSVQDYSATVRIEKTHSDTNLVNTLLVSSSIKHSSGSVNYDTKTPINISKYSKLVIKERKSNIQGSYAVQYRLETSKASSSPILTQTITTGTTTDRTTEIDVSKINDLCYFGIRHYGYNQSQYFDSIYFMA